MGCLIDTSVFVAIERGELDAVRIRERYATQRIAMSAVTASELLHGVERAQGAQRRARRSAFVEEVLVTVEVVPFDLEVSRVHARIWADLRAHGKPIGDRDTMIAATALAHGLAIATRNVRDFARIEGLSVEQW